MATTRVVTATYTHPDGSPCTGYITITPTTAVSSAADDLIIPTSPLRLDLDSEGGVSVALVTTDTPGTSPEGWAYRITEYITGARVRRYAIEVPAGDGALDLADVAPLTSVEEQVSYVLSSTVGHPGGPAGPLDSDGRLPASQIPIGDHSHDDVYAPVDHDHDDRYSVIGHDHNGVYAPALHGHDDVYAPLVHNHDGRYAMESHSHDYAPVEHEHEEYAEADHDHDGVYAPVNHDHDGVYAPAEHDHDDAYAPVNHDHDGVYAPVNHDHDGDYAPVEHDHDGAYAPVEHDHDGDYSPIGHNHDGDYVSTSGGSIITIPGTATQSWRVHIPAGDRSEAVDAAGFYYNQGTNESPNWVRTTYFNEYGETRVVPSSTARVAMRIRARAGQSADLFQVADPDNIAMGGFKANGAVFAPAVIINGVQTAPVLVLDEGDPVPPGTPAGTVILRRSA